MSKSKEKDRSKKWQEATKLWRDNGPKANRRKAFYAIVEQLEDFMAGPDGRAGRKLLAASEQDIQISTGVKDGVWYKYYLTSDGFKYDFGICIRDEHSIAREQYAHCACLLESARDDAGIEPRDFVEWLKKKFDEIAENAPKG